jgi:hypothetical protein
MKRACFILLLFNMTLLYCQKYGNNKNMLSNCTTASLTNALRAVASSIGRTAVLSKIDNTTNALTCSSPVYFSMT